MSILERLPYDLIRSIFGHLDTPTLLNACVASRAINELASWTLYSSIIINPEAKWGGWLYLQKTWETLKNPFKGLQRMPALRNAVRHVTIHLALSQPHSGTDTNLHKARRSCEQLALLPNVKCVTLGRSTYLEELTIYMEILSKWSTVRIFRYIGVVSRSTDVGFPSLSNWNLDHVRTFEMTLGSHSCSECAESKLASRVTFLKSHIRGRGTLNADEVVSALRLSKYIGLRELRLHYYVACDFSWLADQLRNIPSLRILELNFISFLKQVPRTAITSTGLKNLKVLEIEIRGYNDTLSALEIDKHIFAIAGASRLEILSFIFTNNYHPSETRGDRIFKHVVNTHGSTLQVLKLPNFHPPIDSMGSFFLHCPNLRELWIGVTFSMIVQLPASLYQAQRLQTLWIFVQYNVKEWLFSYAESFLRQAHDSLQVFKASGPCKYKRPDTNEWKVLWCYDEDQGRAVRRVSGPDKALLWQHRPEP